MDKETAIAHFKDQCEKSAENLVVDKLGFVCAVSRNDAIGWSLDSFEDGWDKAMSTFKSKVSSGEKRCSECGHRYCRHQHQDNQQKDD